MDDANPAFKTLRQCETGASVAPAILDHLQIERSAHCTALDRFACPNLTLNRRHFQRIFSNNR